MHITRQDIIHSLEEGPVIAALKNEETLSEAIASNCHIVFILCGDICNIAEMIGQIKAAGKLAFVHIDLIAGLSSHEAAVRFIRKNTPADGIISTKAQMIKAAKDNGLLAVQRFFVLDSLALSNVTRQTTGAAADLIEVLPAVSPRIIHQITARSSVPVIVGGLINEKEDVIHMLSAGAIAISSTSPSIWSA